MPTEIRVPLTALNIESTSPAAGDQVECTIRGTVARIDGANAVVAAESCNGEPLGGAEPAEADEPAMPDEPYLRGRAAEADAE